MLRVCAPDCEHVIMLVCMSVDWATQSLNLCLSRLFVGLSVWHSDWEVQCFCEDHCPCRAPAQACMRCWFSLASSCVVSCYYPGPVGVLVFFKWLSLSIKKLEVNCHVVSMVISFNVAPAQPRTMKHELRYMRCHVVSLDNFCIIAPLSSLLIHFDFTDEILYSLL